MRKKIIVGFISLVLGVLTNLMLSYAGKMNSENSENVETNRMILEEVLNESIRSSEVNYTYGDKNTSGAVTLNVEWNEPILGEPTTFHISATGGSENYKFRMDAPSYSSPNKNDYESVADPSRGEWMQYTDECKFHDYTFTMTASGIYNFRFYVMDKTSGVYYLRVSTYIQVSDENYPSVDSIIESAVAQCNTETNGSDYERALWLHDWLLCQLDYDNSLKWSSAESALTRQMGTCQAYESAYAKLLSAAGIENAETRDIYDGHTWNAVKLEGEWYQVDCTWDDTKNSFYDFDSTHLYFGLTDELMALAHQGHNNIYMASGYATRSVSLVDNYFIRNGNAKNWAIIYVDKIQENLNLGQNDFIISANNASYPPSIAGIQNGIIAYVLNQMEWLVDGKKVEVHAMGKATQFKFTVVYPEKEPVTVSGRANLSEVNVGENVTIFAEATGGDGDYTYSFLIHNLDTDIWYRWEFDKSAEHVWTANKSGQREFFVEVKDASGTVARSSAIKVNVKKEESTEKLQIQVFADQNQIALGDIVTISAKATGGDENYTYSFLIHNLGNDEWYRWPFDKNLEHIWTANRSGEREFFAEAKDASGSVVRSSAVKVMVKSLTMPLVVTGKVNLSQVTEGSTIIISTEAAGGAGSYIYSFLIHNLDSDEWYRWPFDKNAQHIWVANGSGNREFFVEVKDESSTVVRSSAIKVSVK